jgi:hypothetical protein
LTGLFSPTSPLTRKGRARRRYNCEKQSEWDDRAETAVALLIDHHDAWRPAPRHPVAIADFGAGNERLRPLLESQLAGEVEYHPYDLHPQLPTTQRLDVSQGLPDRTFDLGICLGLLEYLPSIPGLAGHLHTRCRFVLVSYVASDSPVAIPYDDRVRHGWTTHLTAAEIEEAFGEAGFSSLGHGTSDGTATALWLWASNRP